MLLCILAYYQVYAFSSPVKNSKTEYYLFTI